MAVTVLFPRQEDGHDGKMSSPVQHDDIYAHLRAIGQIFQGNFKPLTS